MNGVKIVVIQYGLMNTQVIGVRNIFFALMIIKSVMIMNKPPNYREQDFKCCETCGNQKSGICYNYRDFPIDLTSICDDYD